MTLLNIQQRFLMMFADYRIAIDRAQRHDDEILHLRSVNEDLGLQLSRERADNLIRERSLNDRLMEMRFGRKAMSPDAPAVAGSPTLEQAEEQGSVRQWQRGKLQQFQNDVRAYQQKVSGSTAPPTN